MDFATSTKGSYSHIKRPEFLMDAQADPSLTIPKYTKVKDIDIPTWVEALPPQERRR